MEQNSENKFLAVASVASLTAGIIYGIVHRHSIYNYFHHIFRNPLKKSIHIIENEADCKKIVNLLKRYKNVYFKSSLKFICLT